jgi:hypothetical protein
VDAVESDAPALRMKTGFRFNTVPRRNPRDVPGLDDVEAPRIGLDVFDLSTESQVVLNRLG